MNYYNDNDPKICAWVRELIKRGLVPDGFVDPRPIQEVQGRDIEKYTHCHFFCGICGWAEAFRLAGFPRDRRAISASCPCQPYSVAGAQKGEKDERNLWPEMLRIIRESDFDVIFGEQVEGAIGHGWLDGVQADLEGEGYAVGHCVLGAHSVLSPHIRQRLYWMAHARQKFGGRRPPECRSLIEGSGIGIEEAIDNQRSGTTGQRDGGGMDNTADRRPAFQESGKDSGSGSTGYLDIGGKDGRMGHADEPGSQGRGLRSEQGGGELAPRPSEPDGRGTGFWDDYELIPCLDGKTRRVKSGLPVLAHGVSARVVRLRGYGNSINPYTAAEFIKSYLEIEGEINASS